MDLHVYGLDPVTLNAGLMKPRRGFTLVAGEEKLGVGKFPEELCVSFLHEARERKGEELRGRGTGGWGRGIDYFAITMTIFYERVSCLRPSCPLAS